MHQIAGFLSRWVLIPNENMTEAYDMRSVAPTVCSVLGIRSPRKAEREPLPEVVESLGPQRRLAVVVIDAFGSSTWDAAKTETPTFNAIANRHLLHLRSVMPTITPVNFATMLTGASPDVHLIRAREEELTHETIFDVLRREGRTSATAARALSSLGILISPFADLPGIAETNLDEDVCGLAVGAIEEGANLVWVQLLDVDEVGHSHGPFSLESIAACHGADTHLKYITRSAYQEGYGLIVLADHGQHPMVRENGSKVGTHGTLADEDVYVPFTWCNVSELGGILGHAEQ